MTHMTRHQPFREYRFLIVFTLTSQCLGLMNCPMTVKIEEEKDSVITCTSQTPFVDVYWYIGPISSTDPILWLQSGKRGGTEYGNTHYDITLRGQMVIKRANPGNAATYTIVAYFEDGTFEQADVTVIITSTPIPSCVTISNCLGCEGCTLNISEPGFLICSMKKVRPQLQVDWEIDSCDGIDFIHHQPIAIYDDETDSWNVSATIAYEIEACGGSATLRCSLHNQDQSTNTSVNTIHLFTEPCAKDNHLDQQESSVVSIICLAVIIPIVILIIIVAGILFIVYRKKKKQHGRKRELEDEISETGVALLPQNDGTRECVMRKEGDTKVNPQTTISKTCDPEEKERKRNILVLELKRYYKTCVDKISIPGKYSTVAASSYTNSQCLVTRVSREDEINEPEQHSINELPDLDYIKEANLVRLFGKAGYGKTSFAHHLLRKWVAKDAQETIMIFLDMKTLDMEADFLSCVLKMVSDESNLTRADIDNILLQCPFFVLVDGCNEMAMVANQHKLTEDAENPSTLGAASLLSSRESMLKDDLKMKHFYSGDVNVKYPKLRMCMMARDTIQKKPFPSCPSVTVKLLGFSSQQTDKFIDNFCEVWNESNSREGRSRARDENLIESNSANTSVADNSEDLKWHDFPRKVKFQLNQILGETGILCEFGKVPLFLTAVTYVAAHDVTSNDNQKKEESEGKNVKLTAGVESMQPQETKFTALIRGVVEFMVSKYSDENCEISKKLAEISLHNKTQHNSYKSRDQWETALGIDKIETALSAGFLEEDNVLTNHSATSSIKFSHDVFADYFAASYFPVEEKGLKALTALIKDYKGDKQNMVFQYLCANNDPLIYKLVEYFAKYEMINNFVNCLYEVEYPDKLELFRLSFQKWKDQNIAIRYTNVYYQRTLHNFLNLCIWWKIKLKTLTLQGFTVSFLVTLKLPDLKQLEISQTDLSKDGDFELFTAWLTRQTISSLCKLIDCAMPDTFSEQSLKNIADLKYCQVERVNNKQVTKLKAKALRGKVKGN